AAERGYVEIHPRFLGVLSFVRSDPSGQSASASGQPTAEAPFRRGSTGTAKLAKRESSLVAAIRAKGEVWVSLRQYRLPQARLDMLASMHGIQLPCSCADST